MQKNAKSKAKINHRGFLFDSMAIENPKIPLDYFDLIKLNMNQGERTLNKLKD